MIDQHSKHKSTVSLKSFIVYEYVAGIVYEYVAGTMVVKAGHALRRNTRCAGRPMEDLLHEQNVALNRTRSPSRPCGSVQAGHHC